MHVLEVDLGGRDRRRQALKRPLPEAQIATLREASAAYQERCKFKPGDIVTPKPTSIYDNKGVPHVVLEISPVAIRNFEPDNCFAHSFGSRLDIRVGVLIGDEVVAFWQESWQHQIYTPAE